MGIEGAWLFSGLGFGPEQHMIVTADPFPFGVDTKGVLCYDVIDFFQFSFMQSIQDMMQI